MGQVAESVLGPVRRPHLNCSLAAALPACGGVSPSKVQPIYRILVRVTKSVASRFSSSAIAVGQHLPFGRAPITKGTFQMAELEAIRAKRLAELAQQGGMPGGPVSQNFRERLPDVHNMGFHGRIAVLRAGWHDARGAAGPGRGSPVSGGVSREVNGISMDWRQAISF